jgi:hypothetical protein
MFFGIDKFIGILYNTNMKSTRFNHKDHLTVSTTYKELQRKIAEIVANPTINFSIFETVNYTDDVWDIKIPDLDAQVPVFRGKVVLFIDYWRVSDVKISRDLENPTWKDLIVATDGMLRGGDGCGIFLEGFHVYPDGGVEAIIGS